MATFNGTSGNDNYSGGNSADLIYGNGGTDFLQGGGGNDYIEQGALSYSSTLKGGAGDDTIKASDSVFYANIEGNTGNDSILGYIYESVIQGGDGNDTIDGGYENVVNGGDGNDILYIHWYDTLSGGSGSDTYSVRYSSDVSQEKIVIDDYFSNDYGVKDFGVDILNFESAAHINKPYFTYLRDNNDLLFINPAVGTVDIRIKNWFLDSAYQLNFIVFSNAEILTGAELSELVKGNYGTSNNDGNSSDLTTNDTISVISSATGHTDYVADIDYGYLSISESGYYNIVSSGNTAVTVYDQYSDDVWVTSASGSYTTGIYLKKGFHYYINVIGYTSGESYTVKLIRSLHGGDGNDTLMGGDGDDWIDGESGNDMLYGGNGNDTIYGGNGDDTLDGGSGDDLIYGGTGDDLLFGNNQNDTIYGGDGNDFFNCRGIGDDILYGGAGNDTYWFTPNYGTFGHALIKVDGNPNANDVVGFEVISHYQVVVIRSEQNLLISYGSGNDVIIEGWNDSAENKLNFFSFNDGNWSLSNELDWIALSGTVLTGTTVGDTLTGNDVSNIVWGLQGNDTIYGLGGDDTLYGGSGNDILVGGSGLDRLFGEGGDDLLVAGSSSYSNGYESLWASLNLPSYYNRE